MTNSPNPNNQPKVTASQRLRSLLFSRTAIALGIPLLLGLAAAAWWTRNFVYQQLAPLVEKNLAQTLNRPVQLGQVERFSPTGLRFGASSVPATTTDPDRISMDAVNVAFDPLRLLFTRTLKLDVTLVNPNIYVQQDQEGRWVATTIQAEEGEGPIRTELDTIRLRNADVVLVSNVARIDQPLPQNTVAIAQVNGVAEIRENNQLVQFDLDGQLKRGGTLALQGDFRPSTGQANLQVRTQDFLASDLTRFIELPLELQAGRVNSNLKVQLTPERVTGLDGTAELKAVTAQVKELPQPFINSQGTLRFKGTQIHLDNVSSSYGKIPGIANGVLDTEAGYNISARVPKVSVANARDSLKIELPVPVKGVAQADVKVTGSIEKPVLSGTVSNTQTVQVDRVNFSNVRTNFALSTADSLITFKDIQATPSVGGRITGSGSIKLAEQPGLAFNAVAQNVPGDEIARLYGVSPEIKIGNVSAKSQVSGTAANPQTVVNWQAPQATYPGSGQIIINDPTNLLFRDTVLRVAGGTVRATGELEDNRWQASIRAAGIQLGRLAEVPPTLQTPVAGTFNFSGTLPAAEGGTIQATGSGRVTGIAGGTVTASNIQVAGERWQAQLQASGVQLQRLTEVPPQLQGSLTGTLNLAGTTAFQPETLRGNGQGRLNVAGGTVTASNIQLAGGRWQALVNASQVQLNRFSEELRGQFGGQLKVAGTLDSFDPATISAAGDVRFSQGVGLIQEPLTAAVNWDGEKIIVQRATAPNLQASGLIFANLQGSGGPEITRLNLNVQAQNYNLQDLDLPLPDPVALAGRANFTGSLTGTLPTPNVVGSLQLQDLVVNNLAFDPVLSGNLQLAEGQGLNLELTGNQDRIALNLDPNNRPTSFLVRRDQAVATGRTEGENLLVNVENFPLPALNLTPPNAALGLGPVAGVLTGNFEINQETFAVVGDLAIAQPAIGRIQGDQFLAQFRYADGDATLTSSEFTKGESRYALAGSLNQTPQGPQFKGQVNITQGQIQDVLTALQFFDLQDFQRGLEPPTYADADVIGNLEVGLPDAALLTQLRRFSEIEVLLQQQRQQRQDTSPMPAIADLTGTFGGEITVNGSLQNGVEANFDLAGSNWQWDNYTANQIIAQGSFENGVLTLLPLRVESDETLLAFNGQIGGTQQSGQLRVINFPVGVLNNFAQLPVEITGNLNATASLAGSTENPQAVGELQLLEGTLNQNRVESATASFSYNNARFNFGSNVVVAGPEPIEITGSIPLQLPFAEVTPDSNLISLDVNVENEGLALLNLLTDQLAWQGGQGLVQLEVRGTLEQPVATGIATVDNATISAQALPAPLTNVTGTVRFNSDRILVEGLQGNFSRGRVAAQGVIPIFARLQPNDPDLNNPLTVTLDQLGLNLEGLYQGGASGNVVVTGTALSPLVGGEVLLAQGQVLLPETTDGTPSRQVAPVTGAPGGGTEPEFNDLRLTLGNAVEVVRPPILNIQATGTLNINGTLNDLRPDGTIRLRRGGVNLFTTQFVLARGYEHTATFTPKQEIDPILDIRLVAVVPEVTQRGVPTSAASSEIVETLSTDVGGLQTVRVQATVEGPASQLFDNLELTSDPSRSESEIVALLGGTFINTLGRGDTALGIANIAGQALLGTYQGTVTNIGNAFGLSELRLFPTVITDEQRARSSTLGLAAEAGVDISPNIYLSVLRVLTADQPTQFGLSYRVNQQVRLRTSTDLSGDSRAVVEYENQF